MAETGNIWDSWGDWRKIASEGKLEFVKRKITGVHGFHPNYCSPALSHVFQFTTAEADEPIAVDFGCGLGRNGPLLKHFFPRVVGLDLPEMLQRLRSEQGGRGAQAYSRLVSDIDAVGDVCLIYDSVVLQHIIDESYLKPLVDSISRIQSLITIVSIYNTGVAARHIDLLKANGWLVWHQETETLSFQGAPHRVTIFHRFKNGPIVET